MDADEYILALQRIDPNEAVVKALNKHTKDAADQNRRQLLEGKRSDDKLISTGNRQYKNQRYARYKAGKNPLPGLGNPDLKLTGSFHQSIQAKIEGQEIKLFSFEPKSENLIEKYSESILGLTDDSGSNLADIIQTDFIDAIAKQSGVDISK